MNLVISQRRGERKCEGLFCCFCFYDEFCLGCFIHSSRSGCKVMLHDHILFLCFGCLLAFVPFYFIIAIKARLRYLPRSGFHPFHISLPPQPLPIWSHTSSFAQLACRVIMIASFIARICTRKTKGIHPGRASPPFLRFDDSNVLPYITLRLQTYQVSSFAQLACRTCTVVGFIARFCSLGNERDSFWESVPSPILSNYSRLRLRPRKTTFTGESFAQLACRVYIIVGFIARFL